MTVIRTLLVYLWAGIVMVGALPYLAWQNHRKKKLGEVTVLKELNRLVAKFAGSLLKIGGCQVEVKGAENIPKDQAVVFVGNHQSNFDIPVLVSYLAPTKAFVVKEELRKIPIFDIWIRGIGCVYIARGEGRKALEAILVAAKKVQEGLCIVVFPEGTRSSDGKLGEFKPGALKIASKAKAAIVPVAIDGTKDCMPKGKKMIYAKKITITVLPAISAETIKATDTKTLAHQIKTDIGRCLGQQILPLETVEN